MTDDAGAAKPVLLGIGAGLAVIALVVAGYVIGYNRGGGKTDGGGGVAKTESKKAPTEKAPAGDGEDGAAAEGPGKSLFVEKCGSCHTLSAAGTSGTAGPSLDQTKFDAEQILKQVEDGGATMPAGLATGKDAKEIADYVAEVVGN